MATTDLNRRFDPQKYTQRIEESRRRFEITRRFEEPDRVPISISTGGSFYARLFGYNIRDYFLAPELNLEVQLKGLQWAYEELQDDRTGYGIGLDEGPVGEAIVFDCPIERPDDSSPRIVPILETEADVRSFVERWTVPDPGEHEGIQKAYRRIEEFKTLAAKMGVNLPIGGGVDIHPPLSCACAIAEQTLVYTLLIEDKELMRRFFSKLLATKLVLMEYRDRYSGRKTESVGLADDNSAFISDPLYREMVMPYNLVLYERYGRKGRRLHADGPNDHHFQTYADVMRLTEMDIGGFSDTLLAKKYLGGKVVFSGGLSNKDLYGDFETALPAVKRALRIAAPGGGYIFAVGGETYAGVNPDTLIKVVAYVKQIGRYPITLARTPEEEEQLKT
ncbi:MAG TPA: hypothetical protein EYP53_03725 [Candidatus Latescibacteria bacterium]|nr:hypothetical protein [Candidatus Latescibacterota bacterium]